MNRLFASLFALLFCLSSYAQVNPLRYNRYTTNLDSAQINGVNLTNIQADNVTGLPAITNALNVKVLTNSANIVIVSNNLQTVSNSLVSLTATVGGLVSTNDANTNKLIATASGRGTNTALQTPALNAGTWTGAGVVSGAILVSNSAARWVGGTNSFTVGRLTNGYWTNAILENPTLTNGVNYGNAFVSAGTGQNSLQLGDGAEAVGDFSVAVGVSTAVGGEAGTAVGNDAEALERGTAVGNESFAGAFGTAYGSGALAVSNASGAFGQNSQAVHPFSTTIGYASITTQTNQIMLGGSQNQYVYAQGRMTARDGYTNALLTGTNLVRGDIAIERTNVVSLANGNNAGVPTLGKSYIKVSGPSAAFNINGLANGRDGKLLLLENNTGYPMTIANNSGIDGTAGNRILTGTAGDLTFSNQPTVLMFAYDSEAARWALVNSTTNFVLPGGSFLPLGGGTMTGTITYSNALTDIGILEPADGYVPLRIRHNENKLKLYDDGAESDIFVWDWDGGNTLTSYMGTHSQIGAGNVTNIWNAGGNPIVTMIARNGDGDTGDFEFRVESMSINDLVWRIPVGTSNFVVSGEAQAANPTTSASLVPLGFADDRYSVRCGSTNVNIVGTGNAAIVFSSPFPNGTSYQVFVNPQANLTATGYPTSKTTNGFTLNFVGTFNGVIGWSAIPEK